MKELFMKELFMKELFMKELFMKELFMKECVTAMAARRPLDEGVKPHNTLTITRTIIGGSDKNTSAFQ